MTIASTGLNATGVSTDLSVSYLSTVKIGDILEIERKVSRIGKTLALTTITIEKKVGEKTVNDARGSHEKYIRQ